MFVVVVGGGVVGGVVFWTQPHSVGGVGVVGGKREVCRETTTTKKVTKKKMGVFKILTSQPSTKISERFERFSKNVI